MKKLLIIFLLLLLFSCKKDSNTHIVKAEIYTSQSTCNIIYSSPEDGNISLYNMNIQSGVYTIEDEYPEHFNYYINAYYTSTTAHKITIKLYVDGVLVKNIYSNITTSPNVKLEYSF